jgi:hypothetical protein
MNTPPDAGAPSHMPAFRYAVGLAALSPLVAETVASSNTPAILFPLLLPLLFVVYGVPVVLVRELWMRGRIGWPGLVVLGAAYAAFNEGVVAATWFKIDPARMKVLVFTAEEAGRASGVNWAVALNLVVYHTIWSIVIPIVLMEAWAICGRGRPWLPAWAIGVGTALVGLVVLASLSDKATDRACDAPSTQIFDECARGRRGSVVFIVVAVLLAVALPKLRLGRGGGSRPGDRALFVIGCAYAVAFFVSFFVLPLSNHATAAEVSAVLLLVLAVVGVQWWTRAPSWDLYAAAILATGALVPGMLTSLPRILVLQPVAVALFVWFFLRVALRRAREGAPARTTR